MTNESTLEIVEGMQYQGIEEQIAYTLTTTNWGSSPSSVTVKVFTVVGSTYTDVTATVMPTGSASVVDDVITLPVLKDLTLDMLYRIEIKFTCSGNVFEAHAYVFAVR